MSNRPRRRRSVILLDASESTSPMTSIFAALSRQVRFSACGSMLREQTARPSQESRRSRCPPPAGAVFRPSFRKAGAASRKSPVDQRHTAEGRMFLFFMPTWIRPFADGEQYLLHSLSPPSACAVLPVILEVKGLASSFQKGPGNRSFPSRRVLLGKGRRLSRQKGGHGPLQKIAGEGILLAEQLQFPPGLSSEIIQVDFHQPRPRQDHDIGNPRRVQCLEGRKLTGHPDDLLQFRATGRSRARGSGQELLLSPEFAPFQEL